MAQDDTIRVAQTGSQEAESPEIPGVSSPDFGVPGRVGDRNGKVSLFFAVSQRKEHWRSGEDKHPGTCVLPPDLHDVDGFLAAADGQLKWMAVEVQSCHGGELDDWIQEARLVALEYYRKGAVNWSTIKRAVYRDLIRQDGQPKGSSGRPRTTPAPKSIRREAATGPYEVRERCLCAGSALGALLDHLERSAILYCPGCKGCNGGWETWQPSMGNGLVGEVPSEDSDPEKPMKSKDTQVWYCYDCKCWTHYPRLSPLRGRNIREEIEVNPTRTASDSEERRMIAFVEAGRRIFGSNLEDPRRYKRLRITRGRKAPDPGTRRGTGIW